VKRFLPLLALAACGPGTGHTSRPYAEPKVEDILAKLTAQRSKSTAFTAESKMDYWLGDQRVKGDVLVMGTSGKKVRFNALSPAGGDVLVDMACDGTNFAYVDKQNNCQLTGPCDRSSIATMLHLDLEPDDFITLALGTPPVLSGATGTTEWSGEYEKVKLSSAAGTQTITVDLRDGRADVIDAEMKDPSGKVMWSVANKDFTDVHDATQGEHRLPSNTRFKSAAEKADLVVEWGERTINPQIDPTKFTVSIPDGLPRCGSKP
jgi:hypothetical protein